MNDQFLQKVHTLIEICYEKYGVITNICQGDLSWQEQAELWTQSRTEHERDKACDYLRDAGASRLAEALGKCQALRGRWATNALPGGSWQQFGEAALIVAVENGRAVWKRDCAAYRWLAFEAVPLGLYSGYNYAVPDVQLITAHRRSPVKEYGWPKIENLLLDTLPQSSKQIRSIYSGPVSRI